MSDKRRKIMNFLNILALTIIGITVFIFVSIVAWILHLSATDIKFLVGFLLFILLFVWSTNRLIDM